MKKLLSAIIFLSLLLLFGANPITAQDTKQEKQAKKEAAIRSLIETQHYSFEAQSVSPLGSPTKQLSYGYELKMRKDTLEAYLPYFGKAHQATIASSGDGGIRFKTTDFKYEITEGKKGGWDITMIPKNAGDTKQLFLSISSNGYGTLQVNSNNKQSISFYGFIRK